MATDWSESIVIADLADEPALSDELNVIADRLAEAETGRVPHVVLNFAAVTYVNSTNLSQLLKLRKLLHDARRSMRLCSVSEDVWSIMTVTGLDKVFRFSPDPVTALASLQIQDEDRKT